MTQATTINSAWFDDSYSAAYTPHVAPGNPPAHFSASASGNDAVHKPNSDDATDAMNLHNETVVNVAALLKDQVGSTRMYPLTLDRFQLDQDLVAEDVAGTLKLTRLSDEIIASIRVRGEVELECQRCLQMYQESFETSFNEEFRQAVDVRTGSEVPAAREDDERFTINDSHELDFAEPLRQEILGALPMRPACGDKCPGPDMLETEDPEPDGAADNRFAALAALLNDESSS